MFCVIVAQPLDGGPTTSGFWLSGKPNHQPTNMLGKMGMLYTHLQSKLGDGLGFCFYHTILVGGWPTPLKNMSSSVGIMTFPIFLESHKIRVPNHQPGHY